MKQQINNDIPEVTGEFNVSILKIGKADAIILKTENHAVIIDCGEEDDGKEIIKKFGDTKADYVIITHYDKDHVGGAAKVIENIKTDNIIVPDYDGTSIEYNNFINAAAAKNISLTRIKNTIRTVLDDVLIEISPSGKKTYDGNDNSFSIVVSATHGENTMLFAGDAEKDRLSELNSQGNLRHKFLKVPHHGRYNEESEKFLRNVEPEIAVITCSEKNPPDDKLLEILSSLSCTVYLTYNGDINVLSNGKTLSVSQLEQ